MLLSLPPYIISYWVLHFHGVHCKSASVQSIANCCALLVSRGYEAISNVCPMNLAMNWTRRKYIFYNRYAMKLFLLVVNKCSVCDETVKEDTT